jgi:DNA repair protein RadC
MRLSRKSQYVTQEPLTAREVLEKAAEILAKRYARSGEFNQPSLAKEYLSYKLGGHDREVFAVLLLDSSHHLLEYRELFYGTIDAAGVFPREVVKAALEANAAAVILAHNHPSGNPEPSSADLKITKRMVDALALIDVRVLDHVIVGRECLSFAEKGLL